MSLPFTHSNHALILMVAIAAILVIGVASAGTYYGEKASIKIKSKGESTYTNVKLAWYMDTTDASCTDSDNGFKPKTGGYISFMDSQGSIQLVMETCVNATEVAELSCIKNVEVFEANGKPKKDFALITTVKCANKCVQGSGVFATGKCI